MIDLHTHLLPGLDDGARDMEEALTLCRLAVQDGTEVVVVTPHSGAREGISREHRPTPDLVAKQITSLQGVLDANGIGLRLVSGMEMHYEPDLAQYPEAIGTLGGSPYVLLELPASAFPLGTLSLVFDLQLHGFIPVIAHPERNLGIIRQPELLHELICRGCLAQITASSLTDSRDPAVRSTAEILLEAGLVHIIASDAHWYPMRPTGLSSAVARAITFIGKERALAMVTSIPQAVLDGRSVDVGQPLVPRRRRPWWRLW